MNLRTPGEVADSINVLLGYWDLELRCRYANAAYKFWFGRSHDEMMGIPMPMLLGPLFDKNLPHISGALKGGMQQFERVIPLPDGSTRHALATYYPDVADGTLRGFTAHVADMTPIKLRELELEKARAQAESSATHDFLTGLPNRVNLIRRIALAMEQAAQQGHFAAVVVLDLDNFKQVNDTYGHPFGDLVLKAMAERMTAALREQQTVKRYGGDEFVLIVPNARTQAGVAEMVERFSEAISQPLTIDGVRLAMSVCSGVSVFPLHGTRPQELLEAADRALYRAKKEREGRINFAH